jgi:hypothetical protein
MVTSLNARLRKKLNYKTLADKNDRTCRSISCLMGYALQG